VNGRYSPYLLSPGLVFQYASKELQFHIWGYSLRPLWGSGVIGFKLLVFSAGTELLPSFVLVVQIQEPVLKYRELLCCGRDD
jgi:hypothetical protein